MREMYEEECIVQIRNGVKVWLDAMAVNWRLGRKSADSFPEVFKLHRAFSAVLTDACACMTHL